ncbi:MAG TPA: bifunctional oligoribonuclease/PAP phosphatase NrnA [Acholeplasmataceae bacterium]|jgi:phosphoesterase RecJ-like protein|nr:bifunctional oligoribonuclease/PAP phosphatase NrnA [Acholeplasmataceae bacterium]
MGLDIILSKIKEYNTIIIHGHIRPDGDCYGAQFGLKDIIKTSFPNKKVYVVGETSEYVSFVGTPDVISDDLYNGALAIVVDTATKERISDKRYTLAKEVIKIDHHIPIDQYGDIIWVDTNFPSCAQMIAYFYNKYQGELKLTKKGAVAMYTGIVTDTGRFRYRGVNELTHQLAGMLITLGAEPDEIDFELSKETLQGAKLKGHVLSNFEMSNNGFIYFKMTRDIIDEYQISDEDAAAMVNMLGGIENHPVWALIIEYPGEIRIRLRSNGPVISDIANEFQGGGHAKAAGGKLQNWDELSRLIKLVDARIIEWRKTK